MVFVIAAPGKEHTLPAPTQMPLLLERFLLSSPNSCNSPTVAIFPKWALPVLLVLIPPLDSQPHEGRREALDTSGIPKLITRDK